MDVTSRPREAERPGLAGERGSGGVRRAVRGIVLFCLLVAFAPAVLAQAVDEKGSDAAIPVSEIPERAQRVAELQRDLDTDLGRHTVEGRIQAELPDLANRIEPEAERVDAVLEEGPSLAELELLLKRWTGTGQEIAERERALLKRAARLEAELGDLEELELLWDRTAADVGGRDVPPVVFAQISQVRRALAAMQDSVAPVRNEVVILQSQMAELRSMVRKAIESIERAREQALANILMRDEPTLWDVIPHAGAGGPAAEPAAAGGPAGEPPDGSGAPRGALAAWTSNLATLVRGYSRAHEERLIGHGILWVALFALILRLQRRTRADAAARRASEAERPLAEAETAGRESEAPPLFPRPLAAATLLALIVTPWLHPELPAGVGVLTGLLLLVPAVLLLDSLLGSSLRPLLTALAVFYLADRVRDILIGVPWLSRTIFTGEMAAGLFGVLWLLRGSRIERLPVARETQHFLRVLGVALRIAGIVFAVSFLGAWLGYVRISLLLGEALLRSAYLAVVLYAAARTAEGIVSVAVRTSVMQRMRMVRRHATAITRRATALLQLAAIVAWGLFALSAFGLRQSFFDALGRIVEAEFGYGEFQVSLEAIAVFVGTIAGSYFVARLVVFVLDEEVYPRVSLPRGVPYALSSIGRYAILLIGLFIALSAAGIDLDRIGFVIGALGVGIGFGLQNVVNNFVSGLILLFERPVHVGDRIQLAGLDGEIRRIGIRSSTVRTYDGAELIVPNANLISDVVTNWTLSDRLRRMILPVGVAYGSDLRMVIEALGAVADAHQEVLDRPVTEVVFVGFGDSSIDFELRAWTDRAADWVHIRTELGVAVDAALREHGIEIPFPQRDLHLKSTPGSSS